MRHPRGFTLLELLVALGLTVLIAGVLAGVLHTAFHARDSALAAVEANRTTDIAGDALTADLVDCLPPGQTLALSFTGAVDDVVFYASGTERKADVPGDVRKVEFTIVADPTGGGRQNLVRRVTTNLLAPVLLDPPDETVCTNVTALTLSYYDGATWYDTWDSTQKNNILPTAVRVVLDLAPAHDGDPPREITRTIPLSCGVSAASTSATGGGG